MKNQQPQQTQESQPPQQNNKKFKITIIIMAVMLVIAFALSAFAFIQYSNLKSQLRTRDVHLVMKSYTKHPEWGPTQIKENEKGYLNFDKTLDVSWFGKTAYEYLDANKEELKMTFKVYPGMGGMLMGINGLNGDLKNFWSLNKDTGLADIYLVDFLRIDFTYTPIK
ncbi:hypothetical protein [Williamsoniiplasma luminosum]|uniref:Uncharacterized protein n=1 Tax=Williamsoniiplasma luminosum TaxID=214888 RepID=A0A2S0NKA4_9MOLU|nr:hypothetical protein [Williamsoniiplasma luminosum]AVP49439.1 MAG: hypothetical protein C5T88_02570 [Williamsoniiplasma luminosum]